MKRHLIITLCLLFLISTAFWGCGDDDCPSCPQIVANAVMFAQVFATSGDLMLYGQITCEDATMPDIDSVKLEGNDVTMSKRFGTGIVGYYIDCYCPGEGVVSGDTIIIEIFTPHGKCEGEVPILSAPEDRPDIIDWLLSPPYDTVALNTDIEINWHPVANSEWYAVDTKYSFGVGVPPTYKRYYTTDTTLTIPAGAASMDGSYGIIVFSVTGPMPDSEGGNITGGYVEGVINSNIATLFYIIVGNGGPTLSKDVTDGPESDFIEIYRELKIE